VYDPHLGRWLSRDPLGYRNTIDGRNLYAYSANDPVNYVDPDGQSIQYLLGPEVAAFVFFSGAILSAGSAYLGSGGRASGGTLVTAFILGGLNATAVFYGRDPFTMGLLFGGLQGFWNGITDCGATPGSVMAEVALGAFSGAVSNLIAGSFKMEGFSNATPYGSMLPTFRSDWMAANRWPTLSRGALGGGAGAFNYRKITNWLFNDLPAILQGQSRLQISQFQRAGGK
jgi:hypothetical protein